MSLNMNNWFGTIMSYGIGFIPFVGNVKGVYEGISGVDSVTGEELSNFSRAMGILSPVTCKITGPLTQKAKDLVLSVFWKWYK